MERRKNAKPIYILSLNKAINSLYCRIHFCPFQLSQLFNGFFQWITAATFNAKVSFKDFMELQLSDLLKKKKLVNFKVDNLIFIFDGLSLRTATDYG